MGAVATGVRFGPDGMPYDVYGKRETANPPYSIRGEARRELAAKAIGLYFTTGLNLEEIGAEVGCARGTVRKLLEEYGVPMWHGSTRRRDVRDGPTNRGRGRRRATA